MYRIGIDLGGTNIAAGIVGHDYRIVRKASVPTPAARPAEEIVRDMGELCHRLTREAGLKPAEIVSVGIAAPGSVDPASGVITYSCNLPFRQFAVAGTLKRFFPVERVYLENDANAAALGKAMGGAARGTRLSVMITLGTGVGGGVILNGKVYSGFNYAGAELGHVVIEYDGAPCSCGRKGCWEAYSSATALVRMTKEKMREVPDSLMWEMCGDLDKVTAKTAFDASRKGDLAGIEVVDRYIRYLACGVTNMINIFQPEVLSIGGGICHEGDYLLKPLCAIVDRDQYTRDRAVKTKVCIASLGNDAGIVGAAALEE